MGRVNRYSEFTTFQPNYTLKIMSMEVWMFSGQGSQKVGMGKSLYDQYEEVKRLYHKAEEILGIPLREVSFYGPDETLTLTKYAQPALLVYETALVHILRERGRSPDLVMGHSLGEFTALHVAGVMDYETTLRVVGKRATLMQTASEKRAGTMAAVIGLDIQTIEKALETLSYSVVIANINSPAQVVISGEEEGIRLAMEKLSEMGAKRVIPLKVSAAFHSPLMEPAGKEFAEFLDGIEFNKPNIPVVLNATAELSTDPHEIKRAVKRQLISPVRWVESLQNAYNNGGRKFVEIGPGRVLQGLAKRTLEDAEIEGYEV